MTKTLTNLAEIAADLAEIGQIMRHAPLDDAMGQCTDTILKSIGENFDASATPEGAAWPPRKRGGSWPLLIKTGALKAAATGKHASASIKRVASRDLEVGINKEVRDGGIPGAAVHNFGYPPKNIPRREYHRPRSDALDRCEQLIADDIDKALG